MPKYIVKKIWFWIIGLSFIVFAGTIFLSHFLMDTFVSRPNILFAILIVMPCIIFGSIFSISIEFLYFKNRPPETLNARIGWANVLISTTVIIVSVIIFHFSLVRFNSYSTNTMLIQHDVMMPTIGNPHP